MEKNGVYQLPDNGFTELWLHYIWKESKLEDIQLRMEDKRQLSVIFPGWYNRSWGPDFSEARILIDGVEFFGDVEIHVSESSWKEHQHHLDPAYNKVILHVFFKKDGGTAINQLGQLIPSLHIGDLQFERLWVRHDIRRPVLMRELPGACGLSLTEEKYRKLRDLIFQAAEQRLLAKAVVFQEEMERPESSAHEDLLFRKICQSAGYSAFSASFGELSRTYPYSEIIRLFRSMHRQNRIEVLGRWFGFMGILDHVDLDKVHDSFRREWMAFRQFWSGLKDPLSAVNLTAGTPYRPFNHPLRRLTGLYYHLEKVQFQGLMKSWLMFLHDCQKAIAQKRRQRAAVISLLNDMFPQPDWDPLNRLLFVTSARQSENKLRLIGEQRQLIILINAVIPYFLAWSKINGDRTLERILFDLFLILPAEGKNRKTRFLEQRLLMLNPQFKMKKNLSYHQGLIQLHDDCCKSYYEGCRNCSLVKLMQKSEIE